MKVKMSDLMYLQVKISGRNREGYSQFSTPVTYSTPSQGEYFTKILFHVSLKLAITRPKLAITRPKRSNLNKRLSAP